MKKIIWAISLGFFLIIAILPIGALFYNAVVKGSTIIQEFRQAFISTRVMRLILNSLTIAFGTGIFSMIIGVPIGFFILRSQFFGKNIIKYLFLLSLIIPSQIATIAWIDLASPNSGLNFFLIKLFHLSEAPISIYGISGVIFVLTCSYFPFMTLLSIAGLSSIDKKLEEQALFCMSKDRASLRISIPLIAPFIISAFLFIFILSLINYGVPAMLRVNTFPMEIFAQFSAFYNHNMAVMLSLPLLILTSLILYALYWIVQNKSHVTVTGSWRRIEDNIFRKNRAFIAFYVWSVIFIAAILPLGVLICSSLSIQSYIVAFKTSYKAIFSTLILSFFGATVCVLVAFPLSHMIESLRSRQKRYVDTHGQARGTRLFKKYELRSP